MSKARSLFLGMFIGGVAGSIITLLSTPKNGNELRETLKQNSTKVVDAFDQAKKESLLLKDQIVGVTKESATMLKDFSKDVKISIEAWKKDIEPSKNYIANELQRIEETLQQLEQSTKTLETGPN